MNCPSRLENSSDCASRRVGWASMQDQGTGQDPVSRTPRHTNVPMCQCEDICRHQFTATKASGNPVILRFASAIPVTKVHAICPSVRLVGTEAQLLANQLRVSCRVTESGLSSFATMRQWRSPLPHRVRVRLDGVRVRVDASPSIPAEVL